MSSWRLAVRELAKLGGTATTRQVAQALGGHFLDAKLACTAMRGCLAHGVAESAGSEGAGRGRCTIWRITPLGREFCAGNLRRVYARWEAA